MRKIFVRSRFVVRGPGPKRAVNTKPAVKAFLFMCVVSFAALAPSLLRADEGEAVSAQTAALRRYELAGFPILGGNSDIGFQFGGAATLTRFYDQAQPYLWNVDLLLSGSVKDDQSGFRLVQQSHVLRLDAPELFHGRMRLDARAMFQRTIN